jgi:hypothetical protein
LSKPVAARVIIHYQVPTTGQRGQKAAPLPAGYERSTRMPPAWCEPVIRFARLLSGQWNGQR